MKTHYETIICPECNTVELAEIKHTFPHWTYLHTCTKCNYIIQESYWDSNGHLWQDDMMNVLYKMKNNSVPIIITDPPYGVRKEEAWDDATLFKKQIKIWLDECLRVAEHTVIWFCANRMFPYIMRNIKPEIFLREHHWNKQPGNQFAGASNNKIWYSAEPILVFTKDKDKTTHSFDEDVDWNYDDLKYDSIAKKIWNHPTVKPTGLISQLVLHYSKKGDTILDPFGGSGTLAEVCIKTERKYIIVEQEEEHFKTILNRITNLNSQQDLFRS